MDRGAWWATAHRSQRVRHDRVTEKSDVTKPANRTGKITWFLVILVCAAIIGCNILGD